MDGKDLLPFIITVGVMIVLVVGAGIALYLVRGRLFGSERQDPAETGGILETMRAMRDRGEISEEEYRTAQASLVGKTGKMKDLPARAPDPTKGRTPPPRPPEGELRAPPGYDLTGEPLPPDVRDAGGRENPRSG